VPSDEFKEYIFVNFVISFVFFAVKLDDYRSREKREDRRSFGNLVEK
jgi:hypothetical protein